MNATICASAAAALLLLAAGSASPQSVAGSPDVKAIEEAAHGGYVAAINSNDVETLAADLTDDVVYQAPGAPEVVGKAAVRAWIAAYVGAYRFHWDKSSSGFTVAGDWAFERYAYKSTETDRKTGVVATDVGKGVNIFHRGADGRWRVAIDGWSSDKPAS
ncbi:MAG TPA: nuclear transport factor 2 family protein [Caulobacteraceae bacterium]|nr:nuclear transport factor 2 family protein [Caulobacteraceae bacterium]